MSHVINIHKFVHALTCTYLNIQGKHVYTHTRTHPYTQKVPTKCVCPYTHISLYARIYIYRQREREIGVRHDSIIFAIWHVCTWHDSFVIVRVDRPVEWEIGVWHGAFICVTWHDSFIRVPRLIHTCAITRSCTCPDSFICVTWPSKTCDMAHSYARQGMTYSYMCHDSFIHVP